MRLTTKINLEVLRQIVEDYLIAENENKQFLRTFKGGWWDNIPVSERIDYTKHYERTLAKSDAMHFVCEMLGLNVEAFISIIKSIQRWERNHGKYDRYAHLLHLDSDSIEHLFQCISEQYQSDFAVGYYVSTGRKIKAV